jgi:hypothetical protein
MMSTKKTKMAEVRLMYMLGDWWGRGHIELCLSEKSMDADNF